MATNGKGRLKREVITVGGPSESRRADDGPSMFQIRKPVGYEERQHLAWSETDKILRKMSSDAWIDDNEEEALLYIVLWNLDNLHPYWNALDDFKERYERAMREQEGTMKIRLLHQLAEDLMDALDMELQRGMPDMDGFKEDTDPQVIMSDPTERN